MVVVQSNIQLVDQKIKQLESANGTWAIVPETGTPSGVQDMLGQANAMLAELKSAAERTRQSAADTTHSSMEERLRAVRKQPEVWPRHCPVHHPFGRCTTRCTWSTDTSKETF